MKTRVEFRKVAAGAFQGDIIAFFVDDTRYDHLEHHVLVNCYEHYGQHGEASADYMNNDCVTAAEHEYRALKAELETIHGYNLEVVS